MVSDNHRQKKTRPTASDLSALYSPPLALEEWSGLALIAMRWNGKARIQPYRDQPPKKTLSLHQLSTPQPSHEQLAATPPGGRNQPHSLVDGDVAVQRYERHFFSLVIYVLRVFDTDPGLSLRLHVILKKHSLFRDTQHGVLSYATVLVSGLMDNK